MTTETKTIIIVSVASLLLLVAGAWLYQRNQPKDILTVNREALVRDNSIKAEAEDEKLVVVEFADYQCPACAYIAPRVKELKEMYKENVTFVYRDFPLNIHRNAVKASQLSYIANEVGKYWEMHEKLYLSQSEWSGFSDPTDVFVSYAVTLGLDGDKVRTQLGTDIYVDRINADVKDANTLGVISTPTFFVGDTIIRSANYDAIKQAINEALALQKSE